MSRGIEEEFGGNSYGCWSGVLTTCALWLWEQGMTMHADVRELQGVVFRNYHFSSYVECLEVGYRRAEG